MSKKLRLNVTIKKHLPIAIEHHKNGEAEQAEHLYRSLYRKFPKNVDVLHFYGRLLFETGKQDTGISLLNQAVKSDPEYSDALNNLGNMYFASRQYDKARIYYEKALSVNSAFHDSMVNLGVICRHQSQHDEAEQWYRKAIQANPRNFSAYNNLAGLLRSLRRMKDAVQVLDEAMTNAADDPANLQGIYAQQSRIHYVLGQTDQALAVYEKWSNDFPDNAVAKHMVASLQGKNTLEKSDSDYVKTLFDGFSSSFDDVLKTLQYKAPELTGEMVKQYFSTHPKYRKGAITLDAGCGTGLCGKYLKPVSETLIGIDLSEGMISQARSLKEYDSLIVAEIEDYLSDNTNKFDLIVSADTFCYFGALDDLFIRCAKSMKAGGMLVFTLEQLLQKNNHSLNEGYFLNPHGRYSHSENYAIEALENAGLKIRTINHETLRMEAGSEVKGLLILAEAS